jgi:hypothetical protein
MPSLVTLAACNAAFFALYVLSGVFTPRAGVGTTFAEAPQGNASDVLRDQIMMLRNGACSTIPTCTWVLSMSAVGNGIVCPEWPGWAQSRTGSSGRERSSKPGRVSAPRPAVSPSSAAAVRRTDSIGMKRRRLTGSRDIGPHVMNGRKEGSRSKATMSDE